MLITHFVWYFEKEKWYDIEILFVDRVLNKETFYGKIMQKWVPKVSPTPLFNFGKSLKTAIACKKLFLK